MQNSVIALQQLDHILRREEAQCDALAHNIQRERQALRTFKLMDMAEVNHQRAELLTNLHVLETERVAWLALLAGHWNLAPSTISLSLILERLETAEAQRGARRQCSRVAGSAGGAAQELSLSHQ